MLNKANNAFENTFLKIYGAGNPANRIKCVNIKCSVEEINDCVLEPQNGESNTVLIMYIYHTFDETDNNVKIPFVHAWLKGITNSRFQSTKII